MALAISAHIASFFRRQCHSALELFERSLTLNPNSALAWGLSGTTLCYIGEPKAALDREAYALRLSPFDPLGFYFTGMSGAAAIDRRSGHSADPNARAAWAHVRGV